jgi:hypothetical protein
VPEEFEPYHDKGQIERAKLRLIAQPSQKAHLKYRKQMSASASTGISQARKSR